MKDSGIEWIGEIPEEWQLDKGKSIFCQRNERGNNIELQILSPSQKLGVVPQSLLEERTGHIAVKVKEETDLRAFKTIHKGDFCISLRSFQGGFEYSAYEGVVSPAYQVFYPIKSISDRFYSYIFKIQPFIDKMNSFTMTLRDGKNISFSDFGNSYIPYPPLTVQYKIADFLDDKCAKIDSLIDHEEATIEELKAYKQSVITEAVTKGLDKSVSMQDSGLEWIGQIPNNWTIGKLKNVCDVFGRIGFRGYRQDDLVVEGEGAITLSPSNMKDMKMNYEKCSYLSWDKYFESPEIQIKNEDILFVKTGSTFGKVALVENLPLEATINPQIIVMRNFKISNRYLCYFLCSPIIRAQIDCSVVGGTIPTISQEKILNYSIIIPSTKQQQEIADYLDKKCTDIDNLISIKLQKIEELKEYKKSLIYEYVTGKKEVVNE